MRNPSLILLGALLLLAGCEGEPTSPSGPAVPPLPETVSAAATSDSVILMVAGDMHTSCTNLARAKQVKATAAIVQRYPQALVVTLGDNAGQSSTSADFECYDQTWGAFKDRTYPVIGNHELNLDTAATAYFDYFNGVGVDSGRAGHRGRAYYSLEYGGWRIFVANNQVTPNLDDQTGWMTQQLANTTQRCTMAIWHRPYFTSVTRAAKLPRLLPWWKVLYAGGADLVVGGHVHNYERFAEVTPDGVVDAARGIREFVVGTGGTGLEDFPATALRGSQKRIKAWGVLKLTLWPNRYQWEFIDVTGGVLDRGRDQCH